MIESSVNEIRYRVKNIFVNNQLPEELSLELANQLLYSEQRGIKSHGLVRVKWILGQLHKYPKLKADRLLETNVNELYDADGVLGYIALNEIVKNQKSASNEKLKIIGVKNTYPTGALSYFAEQLAAKGWLVLMSSSSPRRVGMKDDDKAFVGTNPWTFAVPNKAQNGGYAIVDTSLAELTHGQCLKHLATGNSLPKSAVSQRGGGIISKSEDLWENGEWNAIIHTIGQEKAFKSLGIMWSLHMLCSRFMGLDGDKQHGTCFILLSPSMWEPVISSSEIISNMQKEIDFLETSKVAHVPGSGKMDKYKQNREKIMLTEDVIDMLQQYENKEVIL